MELVNDNYCSGGDTMKKFVSGLIAGVIVTVAVTAFAADTLKVVPNPFPVLIDGVKTEVEGYNINGSTYLKLRDFEKVGLGVDFKDNQIIITTKQEVIESESAKKEGDAVSEIINTKYKGYDAVIKDGVTFVSYEIFRYAEEYMLFLEGEEKNVKIIRKGNPDIERIISADEYLLLDLKIYIPLSIVNELGL